VESARSAPNTFRRISVMKRSKGSRASHFFLSGFASAQHRPTAVRLDLSGSPASHRSHCVADVRQTLPSHRTQAAPDRASARRELPRHPRRARSPSDRVRRGSSIGSAEGSIFLCPADDSCAGSPTLDTPEPACSVEDDDAFVVQAIAPHPTGQAGCHGALSGATVGRNDQRKLDIAHSDWTSLAAADPNKENVS
jgi:uncharacterized phage protein gp47/JayE